MPLIFAIVEPAINQLSEFGKIGIFLILGVLFVLIAYGISHLLAKSKPSPEKLSTYECGETPEGNSRVQFNNRFYVIALVFLLFDVEIIFLFPWSVVFAEQRILQETPLWGWFSFVEMMLFVGILLVGLVVIWVKGDLAWIRPKQQLPSIPDALPASLYAGVNAREYPVRTFSIKAPAEAQAAATDRPAAAAPPRRVFKPRIIKKDIN